MLAEPAHRQVADGQCGVGGRVLRTGHDLQPDVGQFRRRGDQEEVRLAAGHPRHGRAPDGGGPGAARRVPPRAGVRWAAGASAPFARGAAWVARTLPCAAVTLSWPGGTPVPYASATLPYAAGPPPAPRAACPAATARAAQPGGDPAAQRRRAGALPDAAVPGVPAPGAGGYWKWFNRTVGSGGDVGIWHELHHVQPGSSEARYITMPARGLGAAFGGEPGRRAEPE